MEDIFLLTLGAGILLIVVIFGVYIFKAYVLPKKLEEIADMIKAGQIGPAIKRLEKMVEEDDRNPLAHFLLAEAYYMSKQYEKALLEYKRVLKIGKFSNQVKEKTVRQRLAKIYLARKNYEEAKKEFLILTKLDPNNAENYYQVGVLFDNAGLREKALPYFKQAIKINPNSADAYYRIGLIEYNVANYPKAREALEQAVKLNPSFSEAYYYLGMILRQSKEYDAAIKAFEKAAKEESLKGRSLLAIGLCYLEKAQYQKALTVLQEALQYAPKGSDLELNIRYFLAAAAEKIRDFHIAIKNWEYIHDIRPNFKDVALKLKTYEEFRTDDAIKDFMIASMAKFEMICQQIVAVMGLTVLETQVINDSEVHILATEKEEKWKNSRMANRLIYIFRTTDLIPERVVRKLHEEMRSKGAGRGILITTSEFTSQAIDYAQSRPIDLMDKKALIKILRKVV